MGFFDHFKKSELSKSRKEAERNPNPITIEAYCRALIAQADMDQALDEANLGLEKFPDSDRLINVVKYVKKNQLGPRVAELKEKVRTSPSPMLYRQLAELYRDIGDDQRALDTCVEVRERYPKDENTFLVMGEIYYERYQTANLASDGKLAVSNLKRACELNRNNYNALLKLSQLYLSVGLFKQATPYMRNIINFAPADKKVKMLLTRSNTLGEKQGVIDDLDTLFRTVEEREAPLFRVTYDAEGGANIEEVRGTRAVSGDPQAVARELESLDLNGTFTSVIAFDREMRHLASRFAVGSKKDGVITAVQTMIDSIVKQSPRLAMGSFREGVLETGDLGMHFISYPDGFIYLSSRPEARSESIEQQISQLIGRVTS